MSEHIDKDPEGYGAVVMLDGTVFVRTPEKDVRLTPQNE